MNSFLKTAASGLIGIAGFLIGEFDGLYKALLALIIADYITGVIVAIVKRQLSSEIGAKGIAKKILMLIVVPFSTLYLLRKCRFCVVLITKILIIT